MSSFNEFFDYFNQINDIQFESYSFYPFLETIIILLIIYFLYKLYSSLYSLDIKYQNSSIFINCQCEACKKRLKKLIKKNHKNKYTKTYIFILLILSYLVKHYYDIILENQEKTKSFDPYDILQITPLSSKNDVKKAYKKLALLYHPDKNRDDINAKNKFMLINKAYETLTNEISKKNFELYGNPDGPISMRLSLGLPGFIFNKSYHTFILIIFLFIVCIVIPYKFIVWYNNISNFEENGLLKITKKNFKKSTNLNVVLINLPFIIGSSQEFNLIKEPHIKSEITQINNLFDKYRNHFKNKEELRQIGFRIPLNNKKAIGIAYEYSFCDRTDKNYLKLHKLNEYINLYSKLLDAFIDSQKEKLFQLKYIDKHKNKLNELKLSEDLKEITSLDPIVFEFIFSCLIYQECFYQGIPVTLIQKPFISYTQLPHISSSICETFKNKDVDITLEQFLKYADNEKEDILKNIFDFKNTEINDIIEASKAIPRYEYKVDSFVEGYKDTGFIKGDKVTFKIKIKRSNPEDKKFGILHSKYYPDVFNEFIYVIVFNGNNLLKMDKIFINKKETEYIFTIVINNIGIIPIKIVFMSGNFLLNNDIINCQIKCEEKSEKRDEMMKNIENINKNEKIEKSFFQKIISEFFGLDENVEEEEEIEDNQANNKEEEIINDKEKNNENINSSAINKESEINDS